MGENTEAAKRGTGHGTATDAPQSLARLVRQAEEAGASDIHLQMRGDTADVAFRLDRRGH